MLQIHDFPKQIQTCVTNLINLLREQISQSNIPINNEDKLRLNLLNSQLSISLEKYNTMASSREFDNQKDDGYYSTISNKIEVNREKIVNDIYLSSESRVKRYNQLFDFINSNLKDIGNLLQQSLSNKYDKNITNSSNKDDLYNSHNINNINIENLKTDTHDPNNLSFYNQKGMERIEEVTSILTLLNSSKTKTIDINNIPSVCYSVCDFNESDIDEFNFNAKKNKGNALKKTHTKGKDIPTLNEYMNVCNPKEQINILPQAKIGYSSILNSIKYEEIGDSASFLKLEFNEKTLIKETEKEFEKNIINLSPIKKVIVDESFGGITINIEYGVENKNQLIEVTEVLDEITSIIDFNNFSVIGELEKTIQFQYENTNNQKDNNNMILVNGKNNDITINFQNDMMTQVNNCNSPNRASIQIPHNPYVNANTKLSCNQNLKKALEELLKSQVSELSSFIYFFYL